MNGTNENGVFQIPYIVFESERAREERRDKRRFWIDIILIALLALSNIAWMCEFTQFDTAYEDTSTITVDSDGGGNANYIGNDSDIYNGEDYSNTDAPQDANA